MTNQTATTFDEISTCEKKNRKYWNEKIRFYIALVRSYAGQVGNEYHEQVARQQVSQSIKERANQTYFSDRIMISDQVLSDAKAEYLATMTADNLAVRDDVITVYSIAMKLEGYEPVLNVGGCSTLKICPDCQSSYCQKHTQRANTVWACPHCNTIRQELPAE